MPLDPSIILQSQPVKLQSPVDTFAKGLSLQGLMQQNQALGLENQQRQQAISDDRDLRSLFQSNPNPSFADIYGTAGQHGAAAAKSFMEAQALGLKLQKLHGDLAGQQAAYFGSLAGAIQHAGYTPQAIQQALGDAASRGPQYAAQAQQLGQQLLNAPPAQVKLMVDQLYQKAMTAKEQAAAAAQQLQASARQQMADAQSDNAKTNTRNANTQAQNADTNRLREEREEKQTGPYQPTQFTTPDGNPINFNRTNGQYSGATGGLAGLLHGGPTSNASMADQRANQMRYEQNAKAEGTYRGTRDALHSALQAGNVYVDKSGKVTPFASMHDAMGGELSSDAIASLKNDMNTRMNATEALLEQAVADKNDAMLRNGQEPGVSTDTAIKAYRQGLQGGKPTGTTMTLPGTPAAPQGSGKPQAGAQQPPTAIVSQMQVGKVTTFRNGQKWLKNADGSVQQITQ